MIDDSTITIFCPCWNEPHLGYLRKFVIPSLLQPGNLPACGWSKIVVRGSTIGPIEPLMRTLSEGFEGIHGVEYLVSSFPNHESALLDGLRHTIRHCISTQTRMLLLMPDTIFSNGGIFNMRQYARRKPVSVAAPHLRVIEAPLIDTAPRIPEGPLPILSSQELVRYAMANPHQSLTDSFSDRDNGTRTGGISLTRISEKLTTIIHYLPTTYLAWFTESDADFFDKQPYFGSYDHYWLPHLGREGRLRVVSNSEFFFAVELTQPHLNRIPVHPNTSLEEHSEFGHLPLKAFVGTLHG